MARTTFAMPADLPTLLTLATLPGIIPDEARPLRAFIAKHGAAFDELRFRVMLGDGLPPPEGAEPAIGRVMATWGTLRPDLVGWKAPNQATIIEAKQSFGSDAVWQLQSYRDAWRRAFPGDVIRLVGVAEFAAPTARAIAQAAGVALYIYAFPPGEVDISARATEEASGDGA